jgi:hypothetical protein
MAQLTDLDLFTGVINIDTSNQGTIAELNSYCETEEANALLKLLGRTLYTEYIGATSATKWTNLINGVAAAFEYDGKTMKYMGLKNYFCYLIYTIYTRDQITGNTPMGDVAPKPSNGEQMYNIPRAVKAYNLWVDYFNDAVDYINYINSQVANTYEGFDTAKLEYVNTWGI